MLALEYYTACSTRPANREGFDESLIRLNLHLSYTYQELVNAHYNESRYVFTYNIRSACFVKCPKRWVTNIMVFPSRIFRSPSKRWSSPSGSMAEVGSSTITSLIVSEAMRINVLEATNRWCSPPKNRFSGSTATRIQMLRTRHRCIPFQWVKEVTQISRTKCLRGEEGIIIL